VLDYYYYDSWLTHTKIESSRLDYVHNHQKEIRANFYQGLLDSLDPGEGRVEVAIKQTVMPSSFIRGPHDIGVGIWMAMALVCRFGKIDILLTMTCNPN